MAAKKDLVIGIDGTNSREILDSIGSNSHVYRILNALDKTRATSFYFHGPGTFGTDVSEIRSKVLRRINSLYAQYEWESLSLFGWSRGGHIACQIAKKWGPKKIRFLGLFDAVDRTIDSSLHSKGIDTSTIPRNVQVARHAMRSWVVGSRDSFDPLNLSIDFDNTATKASPGVDFLKAFFMTSHGGAGGSPGKSDGGVEGDGWNSPTMNRMKVRHGSDIRVCRGPEGMKRLPEDKCSIERKPLNNVQMDHRGSHEVYSWIHREARLKGKLPL